MSRQRDIKPCYALMMMSYWAVFTEMGRTHLQAVGKHDQDSRYILHGKQHALERGMQFVADAALCRYKCFVHLQHSKSLLLQS